MNISFEIPQDIEQELRTNGLEMNREAKEAYLINLYREERITHRQLAEALGLNRYETDGVLKRYKVSPNVTAQEMRLKPPPSRRHCWHRGGCRGPAAVPLDGAEDEAANWQCFDQQGDLRAGQAAVESRKAAGAAVAALVPRDSDYRFAHAGRAARRCEVSRGAQQPANDRAL